MTSFYLLLLIYSDSLVIFQIEYHYGYKNLNAKLEKCSFKVSFSRPHALYIFQTQRNMVTKYAKRNWVYPDYIYAKRN
jgi:hypothetical protein